MGQYILLEHDDDGRYSVKERAEADSAEEPKEVMQTSLDASHDAVYENDLIVKVEFHAQRRTKWEEVE